MTGLYGLWQLVRFSLLFLILIYVGLVLYRIPAVREEERTKNIVAYIANSHISLADVMETELPSTPNVQKSNASLVGIDTNNNGIRDDVELAIFKQYPNNPRVRAAELQYAKALQLEVTSVFNSETLVAVIQQENRSFRCIDDAPQAAAVESLVFNAPSRTEFREALSAKYMTSLALAADPSVCDLGALK